MKHLSEAVAQRCPVKNCSEKFCKFTVEHLCRSLVVNKFEGLSEQRC